MKILLVLIASAALALAADATGKWVATVEGRNGNQREITYDLKADGNRLTGTVTGMRGREMAIEDGKVDGDNVSFATRMQFNGNEFVMNYKGTVSGDQLKLTQSRQGSDRTREITAKRAQ